MLFFQSGYLWPQEKLFQQVFKKTTARITTLPVVYNGNFVGDLKVRVINAERISEFEKEKFKKIIEPIIDTKVIDELFKDKKDFFKTSNLDGSGIFLDYDLQNLVLRLSFDSSILKVRETRLAFNSRPKWAKDAIIPGSDFSGFINIYNYYQKTTGDLENTFYTGDQNYNINYKNWSFFGRSTYQNDKQRKFSRQDIRVTYDDIEGFARYQIGDLSYSTEQYQGFVPAAGILKSTNFNLNPYRLFNPAANREIYLENNSTVRIYVNSILIRTIRLPAGRHLIEELPLNEGLNNVTIEILDDRGRRETFAFDKFTSFNLIKKGLSEYSYAVGKTSLIDNDLVKYKDNDKQYIYLANHIWGASDFSNIGFNINGNRRQNVMGLIGRVQSKLGLSELNLTRSQLFNGQSGEEGSGFASLITHRLTDYSNQRRLKNIQLSLEYLSPKFTSMGLTSFNQYASLSPEINYGQFISDNMNIRLGARFNHISNKNISSFYNLNTGVTALVNKNYQISSQYSYSKFRNGVDEHQIILTLNYSLPERGQFATATYNSVPQEKSLNLAYNGRSRPDSFNARANLLNAPERQRYQFDIERFDQWYTTSIGHEINNGQRSNEQNNTNLTFHTSLAFVGDYWSISRPINESFIMVKTEDALSNIPLYIDRNEDNYTASTGPFSSAVIPFSQAYRFYPLKIDPRNIPVGVEFPKYEYVMMAPFRGGVLLKLTAKKNRAVVGKLFDGKQVMDLAVGYLESTNNKNKIPFFTNRKGRFLIESIEQGEYKVIVNDQELGIIKVDESGENFIFWENK